MEVPGEIPPQLAAYKQQQARWAIGNTQCLLKLARPIISSKLRAGQKIMAIQHLCQYLPQPLMLLMLLLTPPLLLAQGLGDLSLAPLGIIGLAPPLMYIASQTQLYPSRGALRALAAFPALLFIGTGISLSNSLAVASALLGIKTPFRRTPKFERDWKQSRYALASGFTLWLELALMVYALWAAALAWELQRELCLYLLIYALSLATVCAWSLCESWIVWRARLRLASHKSARASETI